MNSLIPDEYFESFRSSMKRESRIQKLFKNGWCVVQYDVSEYPFPTLISDMLIEKGFVSTPVALDLLHRELTTKQMAVDEHQINGVVSAFYDTNDAWLETYRRFMDKMIAPVVGHPSYIQRTPTIRFSFPNSDGMTRRDYHTDIMLGHPPEEINVWVPFTDSALSRSFVMLPLETSLGMMNEIDFDLAALRHRIWTDDAVLEECRAASSVVELRPGDALLFDARCMHGSLRNESDFTRISMDVRLIPAADLEAQSFTYRGIGRRRALFAVGDYYAPDPVGVFAADCSSTR